MQGQNKLYHRSTTIFCHAYCNNTIEYGSRYGSPIGNLIAANLNYEIKKKEYIIDTSGLRPLNSELEDVFEEAMKTPVRAFQWFKDGAEIQSYYYKFIYADEKERRDFFQPAMKEIDATGYTIHDLYTIEYAFENEDRTDFNEDQEVEIIYGLFAAIKQLRVIHELYDFEEPMRFSENIGVDVPSHVVKNLIKRHGFLKP